MATIEFPQTIKSNCDGYAVLAKCMETMFNARKGDNVTLDFNRLYWMDANLVPIIGVCIEETRFNINIKYRQNIRSAIQNIWAKNWFGNYFGLKRREDTYNTVVSYKIFKADAGKEFGLYIDEVLLAKKRLPQMTDALKKQISNNIQEIFGNAPMHGSCSIVCSCGQILNSHLMFTIANLGHTIKENVEKYFELFEKNVPPSHSIEWAIIEDNSTKRLISDKSGGKGLAFLNEFIRLNKGEIHICSDNEYWQTSKDGEMKSKMYSRFPGTIVTIVINLNDTCSYCLKSEMNDFDDLF